MYSICLLRYATQSSSPSTGPCTRAIQTGGIKDTFLASGSLRGILTILDYSSLAPEQKLYKYHNMM